MPVRINGKIVWAKSKEKAKEEDSLSPPASLSLSLSEEENLMKEEDNAIL